MPSVQSDWIWVICKEEWGDKHCWFNSRLDIIIEFDKKDILSDNKKNYLSTFMHCKNMWRWMKNANGMRNVCSHVVQTHCKTKDMAYSTWTLEIWKQLVIFHWCFSGKEKAADNSIIHFWSILWWEKNEKRKWTHCLCGLPWTGKEGEKQLDNWEIPNKFLLHNKLSYVFCC